MTAKSTGTQESTEMNLDPQVQLELQEITKPRIRLGLVGNYADSDETRMLLTPEACGMLTSYGIGICMEAGAGVDISFPD